MAVFSDWGYMAMQFVNSIEIGFRIREFRQKKGLSQERLAELVNLSPQQMQKYEAGGSKLNTDKLQLLADALGVTIFAFFEGYFDTPYTLSQDEKRLVEAYRAIKHDSVRDGFLTCLEYAAAKK